MTTTDRHVRALTTAADDLAWLNRSPHRLAQIVGLYAEMTRETTGMRFRHGATPKAMADALAAASYGVGGEPDPSWSDPTGNTAQRNLDHGGDTRPRDRGDETLAEMTHALGRVCNVLDTAGRICSVLLDRPLPGPTNVGAWRTDAASAAATRLAGWITPALAIAEPIVRTELDDLVCHHLDTEWLRTKAEGIWDDAHGDRRPVAEQRRIVGCSNCSRYGITGTMATDPKGDVCALCSRFRRDWKCLPCEAMCREQDRKGERARATPALVAESRRLAKITPGRGKVTA